MLEKEGLTERYIDVTKDMYDIMLCMLSADGIVLIDERKKGVNDR